MPIDIGTSTTVTTTVVDVTGTPGDATTVTGTVTAPSGVSSALTVTHAGTGVYSAVVTPAVVGLHVVRFTATGGAAGAGQTSVDVVDVVDTAAPPIVSLADLRAHIGVTSTSIETTARLRQVARVASERIRGLTGLDWVRVAVSSTVTADASEVLVLPRRPVIGVASVTVAGVTADPSSWEWAEDGRIAPVAGTWTGQVTVAYTAGPVTGVIPDDVRQAVLELARHVWETHRGGSGQPRLGGADDLMFSGAGYLVPNRVAELLADYVPGV